MSEEKPIKNFILEEYLDSQKTQDRYRRTGLSKSRENKRRIRHLRKCGLEVNDIAYVLGISTKKVEKCLRETEGENAGDGKADQTDKRVEDIIAGKKIATSSARAINVPLTEKRAKQLSDERTARIINALEYVSPEEIMRKEGLTNSQFREILLSRGIVPSEIQGGENTKKPHLSERSVSESNSSRAKEPKLADSKSQKVDPKMYGEHIDTEELKRRLAAQERRAKEIVRAKRLSKTEIHSEKELYDVMREIFGLKCSDIALKMGETYLRKGVLSADAKRRLRKGIDRAKEARDTYLSSEGKSAEAKTDGEER